MNIRFTLFAAAWLLASLSVSNAELIPAHRLAPWVPGVDVGVVGGIDQYRPGGANARTTLIDVTAAPYNADNTGATDASSAINSAITAATSGQVVYIPAGLYRINSSIATTKSNITIRGAGTNGPFVASTSSVTVGTGTKVFQVPSGEAWTPGCGIMVCKWERRSDSDWGTVTPWMKGTVTSYSGTTLTINVTSVSGTGTFDFWRIGITTLDSYTTSSTIRIGSSSSTFQQFAGESLTNSLPLITGSPTRGADTLTVDTRGYSWVPQIGHLAQVQTGNHLDANSGAIGDSSLVVGTYGFMRVKRQMTRITAVSGPVGSVYTVTISPALRFAAPSSGSPTFFSTAGFTENTGVENLWIRGDNSTTTSHFDITTAVNCWGYRVAVYSVNSFGIGTGPSMNLEYRECWSTHRRSGGPGGGGFITGHSCNMLVIHNVFGLINPAMEINNSTSGSAFLFNYLLNGNGMNTNHGPWNSFNLFEGNVTDYARSDGYFGGESEATHFRNWYHGLDATTGGSFNAKRLSYNFNFVGNVFGEIGVANGDISYGEPNIGNGDYVTPGASMINGQPWLHLNSSGPTVTGVVSNYVSSSNITVTMDSHTSSVWDYPNITSGASTGPIQLWWGTNSWRASLGTRSGANVTLTTAPGQANNAPALSTNVILWPGVSGMQERDLDVQTTAIEKGNYFVSGLTGGSQSSTGGDTIPDSLAFSAQPQEWPDSLAWPAVNPANPGALSANKAIIPSAYLHTFGEWPADGGGGAGSATIQTLNVGTLVLP